MKKNEREVKQVWDPCQLGYGTLDLKRTIGMLSTTLTGDKNMLDPN